MVKRTGQLRLQVEPWELGAAATASYRPQRPLLPAPRAALTRGRSTPVLRPIKLGGSAEEERAVLEATQYSLQQWVGKHDEPPMKSASAALALTDGHTLPSAFRLAAVWKCFDQAAAISGHAALFRTLRSELLRAIYVAGWAELDRAPPAGQTHNYSQPTYFDALRSERGRATELWQAVQLWQEQQRVALHDAHTRQTLVESSVGTLIAAIHGLAARDSAEAQAANGERTAGERTAASACYTSASAQVAALSRRSAGRGCSARRGCRAG